MSRITASQILRTVQRDFRYIYRNRLSGKDEKELKNNEHLVRNCCLLVIDAKSTFSQCDTKTDEYSIFESTHEFCEISGYCITESELERFLKDQGEKNSLSYAEIACLIPALIFWCIHDYSKGKCTTDVFLRTLRILRNYDGSSLTETLSKTELVLLKDAVYPQLDNPSKNLYRQAVSVLAKRKGTDERKIAVDLLTEARKEKSITKQQIGEKLLKRKNNRLYFPLLILLFFALSIAVFLIYKNFFFLFLSLVPAFISAKILCDTLFSRGTTPRIMPKIQIDHTNCPITLVTIVSILKSQNDVKKLLHRLDVLAHGTVLNSIRIGLLLDFPSSKTELTIEEQEILDDLQSEIEKRNVRNNRFFCAVRKRCAIEGEYRFEARGRKQGAIIDFAHLITGESEPFSMVCGTLQHAKYMVALDADTEPTPESIERLIGFMEHPNHSPTVSFLKNGTPYVSEGYGIAAPRIEADPRSSTNTIFSKISAGNSGTELYHNPHFNLYQDLFSEGIFCGKGIINLSLYQNLIGNRFSENHILSHDLPEGEILRCANLSDVVFFDEIPDNVLSDEKRNHRWIRGDFQNMQFLSPAKSHSSLFRFKIFHNLCRALFSFFCLLLIVSAPIWGINSLFLSLFWLNFPIFMQIPGLIVRWSCRYRYLHPYRGFFRTLGENAVHVALLPSRAMSALDAALRGTYRLLRNKKQLEWSTAASSAGTAKTCGDFFYRLKWQQLGFLLVFLPTTTEIGLIWMIAPIFAYIISQPKRKTDYNDPDLKDELSAMWQYYADLTNEANHWLPPDNYQQEPSNTVANRTSPTNIGLGMLSCLGAHDLKLITTEQLLRILDRTLTTVENLGKWHGHLYNWYDTHTCKILNPKFVSTVDCGNFAAALHTLRKGLQEFSNDDCNSLINRIDGLLSEMDFSHLYNKKKHLFSIGYDGQEEQLSESCYDLFASEARLTSFYAVMRHQVSVRHWATLGRPVEKRNATPVLLGWSGTMFEYFMPHIFLPVYPGSFVQDVLDNVMKLQTKRSTKKIPWGISESGYYAFDERLNYQYRAFGIKEAALRRDVSFPSVISAYSTFLAYPFYPLKSERNKKMLPKGKYGYFEAVDYRLGEDNPRTVQSFMAHHVGMSFLSGVNLLCQNIMQKRFMETEGECYSALLCETTPNTITRRLPTITESRDTWQPPEIKSERPDPEHPKVRLLQNGSLCEIISDSGSGYLRQKQKLMTAEETDPQSSQGIFLFLRHKGTLYGTTYAPLYEDQKAYRIFFDKGSVTCYGDFREFDTRLSVTLHPEKSVSIRELTIKNNQMTENSFDYYLSLQPILCKKTDYEAHPEYNNLFLQAEYDTLQQTVFFHRTTDGENCWLAFSSSARFSFDVRRDSFGDYNEIDKGVSLGCSQYPLFPHLFCKGEVAVRGKGTETVRFFLATGDSKEDCIKKLETVRTQNFEWICTRYGQSFDAFCYQHEIRSGERILFDQLSARILMPYKKSVTTAKLSNSLPRKTLWEFGISGDNPIVTLRIGTESADRVVAFLKCMQLFLRSRISVDLIIVFRENEGYFTPLKEKLNDLLSGFESDVKKHVFLLNIHSVEEYLFLQKVAKFFVNLERGWKPTSAHRSFRPIQKLPAPDSEKKIALPLARGGYLKDGAYQIQAKDFNPLRPWGLVIANGRLGTVINERSLGYTFARNASENKLTPRISAFGYELGGEKYYAVIRGKHYDLLSCATVEFRPFAARYRSQLFDITVETEVFIPPYLPAKILRIKVIPSKDTEIEIVYEPRIILGKNDEGTVTRWVEDDRIYYQNQYNDSFGKGVAILFSPQAKPKGDMLSFHPTEEQSEADFILGYGEGPHGARQLGEMLMSNKRNAKELRKAKAVATNYLHLDSPDEDLNYFVNGFLQQQILQSRILGRTGTCQPGGAYGFRDQLQDCLCIAPCNSIPLKHQILRCCSHQFEEGDVLHWWHSRPQQKDDGIRTRFSDDPFWLVYACTEYYRITHDEQFFQRNVRYLKGKTLTEQEKDRYFHPEKSDLTESVYQHGIRAFQYGYKTGRNGLIRFGSGDWNDGLNNVGEKGETVWGSMFALLCAERFVLLASKFGTQQDGYFLSKCAADLRKALSEHCFEHGQYLRGFREDGTPFGAFPCIDLIPQAFAALCGLPNQEECLHSAYDRLWDKEKKIIRLLTPPYEPKPDDFPGNIAQYPPGVRENGGQYTHAGLWFAKALFESGSPELAAEILLGINPVSKNRTIPEQKQYQAEPYVLAADVYTLPDRFGMGGWTHYTGAAGWYFKVVTENLLGISRNGKKVQFTPSLPKDWSVCNFSIRIEQDQFHVHIERGTDRGIYERGRKVPFMVLSGQEHKIQIII